MKSGQWSPGCIFVSVWDWLCHSCQCAILWLMVLPTVGEGNSGGREREKTESSDTASGMKCFLPLLTEMLSGVFSGNLTQMHMHTQTHIHSFIHSDSPLPFLYGSFYFKMSFIPQMSAEEFGVFAFTTTCRGFGRQCSLDRFLLSIWK